MAKITFAIKSMIVIYCSLISLLLSAERLPPELLQKKAKSHPIVELLKAPADNYRSILSLHIIPSFVSLSEVRSALEDTLSKVENPDDKAALIYLLTECNNMQIIKRARNLHDLSGFSDMNREYIGGLLSAWKSFNDSSGHEDLRHNLENLINSRLSRDVAALPASLKQEIIEQYLHAPGNHLEKETWLKVVMIYINFGLNEEIKKKLDNLDQSMSYWELFDIMQAYKLLGYEDTARQLAEKLWELYIDNLTRENNLKMLKEVLNCLKKDASDHLRQIEPQFSQKPWLNLIAISLLCTGENTNDNNNRRNDINHYIDKYVNYVNTSEHPDSRLLKAQAFLKNCRAYEAELCIIDALQSIKSEFSHSNEIVYILKRADCLLNLERGNECLKAYEHALNRARESDIYMEASIRRKLDIAKLQLKIDK